MSGFSINDYSIRLSVVSTHEEVRVHTYTGPWDHNWCAVVAGWEDGPRGTNSDEAGAIDDLLEQLGVRI
jgi:hypothetical protein